MCDVRYQKIGGSHRRVRIAELEDFMHASPRFREYVAKTDRVIPIVQPRRDRAPSEDIAAWDASAVSATEIGVVKQFLDRRYQIDRTSREALAGELVRRLSPKVARPEGTLRPERFLERVVEAKEGLL
jgi:hypothetical protein